MKISPAAAFIDATKSFLKSLSFYRWVHQPYTLYKHLQNRIDLFILTKAKLLPSTSLENLPIATVSALIILTFPGLSVISTWESTTTQELPGTNIFNVSWGKSLGTLKHLNYLWTNLRLLFIINIFYVSPVFYLLWRTPVAFVGLPAIYLRTILVNYIIKTYTLFVTPNVIYAMLLSVETLMMLHLGKGWLTFAKYYIKSI